jgi:hypothetical protein
MGTPAIAKLCGRGAPVGSRAYLQQSQGTGHAWRTVGHAVEVAGDRCSTLSLTEPVRGRYLYRAELWAGTALRYQTPGQVLTVYGPVGFTTWCRNVTGCHLVNGGGGLVQVEGHIDDYFDWVCGSTGAPNTGAATTPTAATGNYCSSTGFSGFPQSYTLGAGNSCRSLTMATAAVAKDNGASGGRITIEVLQHTLGPQIAVPREGRVLTSRFALDGGPVLIDLTNTGPLSLYLLKGSADCYTSSGTVTSGAPTGALVRVISGSAYQFDAPDAMAVAGPDLFVANYNSKSVTELDAFTGALVRVISSSIYQFDGPDAMGVAGDHLFVSNWGVVIGSSVSELNASTGALVRVISAPAYQFYGPHAMAVAGDNLFVANSSGGANANFGSVTELDASTGALVRVISGPTDQFDSPDAMAVAGPDLFVANNNSGSITELDASSGMLVRVIAAPADQFWDPDAMAVAGTDLFVANGAGNYGGSVSELNASTGALVRVISAPGYQFDSPYAIALAGADLFVANGAGNYGRSVTELNASTGALVRVISGSKYQFDGPDAMAVAGDDLFAANWSGNSVTELSP